MRASSSGCRISMVIAHLLLDSTVLPRRITGPSAQLAMAFCRLLTSVAYPKGREARAMTGLYVAGDIRMRIMLPVEASDADLFQAAYREDIADTRAAVSMCLCVLVRFAPNLRSRT